MSTTNWGKYPVIPESPLSYKEGENPDKRWIPRGMGRCYGDSSLGEYMISSSRNQRILSFDKKKGIVRVEAGMTYEQLISIVMPHGWFPMVTPGTKFVSMGGAMASDVHGKNHHKDGGFSDWVVGFRLLTGKGEVLEVTPNENKEIFEATAGGMGLTGFILDLSLQLKKIESNQIKLQSYKATNLDEVLDLFEEHADWTYSVAWIDTLAKGKQAGRSILLLGEHATEEEVRQNGKAHSLAEVKKRRFTIPFDLPSFSLNPLTIGVFNQLYYHKHVGRERSIMTDYDSYFYPLDILHHWNRIYGKKGFTQYQLVIPKAKGREGLPNILTFLQKNRLSSFLSVLKLFGPETGLMSFPMEGYTLTLDFPISNRLFPLLEELDQLVLSYGGRVYLTKDVRLPSDTFRKMYPNLSQFEQTLSKLDPEGKVASLQSHRLAIRSL
ncbi:MAG: FAD-binding oxidoreductase [Bacteroidota bacterium]